MRESGILMPVSSLPGPYGIGCFGKEAFKFVDFLAQAGQKIWQILPLSPTGYGDSPYQSCSAFAGNPYFIDLDALKEEGLLTAAQLKAEKWGTDPKEVDYGTLYVSRFKVLRTAYAAWRKQCTGLHGCSYYFPDDYYAFTLANEEWLDDYALYMALKVANGMKNWVEWDKPYRLRDKKALAAFAAENEEEIGFWKFVQYKFAAQWQAVKAYANIHEEFMRGHVTIIGCPKLDAVDYSEKLTEIIRSNDIKSVTVLRMEVPCCGGLEHAAITALKNSGKFIPWNVVTFSTDGRILDR